MQFRVLVGDITKWPADAIVNSASSSLLGLSGAVDRAVHKAGGISLTAACRSLKGCRTGDAKITFGYKLPAKYVIHAVGPIWVGGKRGEEEELLSCYRKSLSLAEEKGVRHLAFTSVSTEDKRYPRQRAAAANGAHRFGLRRCGDAGCVHAGGRPLLAASPQRCP